MKLKRSRYLTPFVLSAVSAQARSTAGEVRSAGASTSAISLSLQVWGPGAVDRQNRYRLTLLDRRNVQCRTETDRRLGRLFGLSHHLAALNIGTYTWATRQQRLHSSAPLSEYR